MEVYIIQNEAPQDQVTAPWDTNPLPSISQLPTELLTEIIQLSLPEIEFKLHSATFRLRSHMMRLYIMRSVSKRWQAIIEGTPSFWVTIASTLPSDVTEASALHSSNLPLSIIYYGPRPGLSNDHPSAIEFLKLVQHTRPRWSSLVLDLFNHTPMSDYLGVPLPLLQTIIVRSVGRTSLGFEPLELLGGDTSNLRFAELSGISIRWRMGLFVQLKCLKLKDVANDGLTVPQLLNVLRASPGLQALKLTHMIGTDIPQHPPTIPLRHLKYIKLQDCDIGLVECILRRVRAPSCTRLSLNIGDEGGFDFPHFLNESLQPFHSILRAIHRLRGGSEVVFNSRGFEWHTPDYSKMEGFSIYINNFFDPFFPDWVDRILKDDSGPWINFASGGTSNETVLGSIAPMRRVTKATIGDSWRGVDVSAALQFLGKPLTTSASLPSLPCLQELILPSVGWNARELLEMVQSRFCALSWETMERTPLTINVQYGGVAWVSMDLRPIPDLVTIIEIRKTSGVKCFNLPVGWTNPVGMLAVTWNEETSQPVWI